MRVISGSAKGTQLKSVPGDTTRPITDRTKESLFNILGADVPASTWWDLFAGTGAVGIEALSRGADFVRFTDLNRLPVKIIRENLRRTHLASRAEVRRGDAFVLLKTPPDRTFEYIYIAPPQYAEMWAKALHLLDENMGWLTDDAWVIVQIHPVEYQPLTLRHLQEIDQRKYGSTLLVFYEIKP